ncbi:hypothetical protein F4818DRAFT_446553 [Hypoxylon cercidicola]|nr:hypothetical protein F4818DRAFT_446553 [Hypoxylon cercidicola]
MSGTTVEFETDPPARAEVVANCPQLTASPTSVRNWFREYLAYRGLDPEAAYSFLWTGAELHGADAWELHSAFEKHCDLHGWEADILTADVYTILKESVQPKRTAFQAGLERISGVNTHQKSNRKPVQSGGGPMSMDYLVRTAVFLTFVYILRAFRDYLVTNGMCN